MSGWDDGGIGARARVVDGTHMPSMNTLWGDERVSPLGALSGCASGLGAAAEPEDDDERELRKRMQHLLPSPRAEDKELVMQRQFKETLCWIFRSKWFEFVSCHCSSAA